MGAVPWALCRVACWADASETNPRDNHDAKLTGATQNPVTVFPVQ